MTSCGRRQAYDQKKLKGRTTAKLGLDAAQPIEWVLYSIRRSNRAKTKEELVENFLAPPPKMTPRSALGGSFMGTHSASLRGGANTCAVEHRGDPLRAASAGLVGNDQDLGRAIRALTKLNLFSLISRSGLNLIFFQKKTLNLKLKKS